MSNLENILEAVTGYTNITGDNKNEINLGGSIITGMTFITLIAWVEAIFYDFRHSEDEDLIESEVEIPTVERRGNRSRADHFKFAIALTLTTVAVIFIFKKCPLRITIA